MSVVIKKMVITLCLAIIVHIFFYVAAPQFGGFHDDLGDLGARSNVSSGLQDMFLDGRVNNYAADEHGSYDFVKQQKTAAQADHFLAAYYRPVALLLQIHTFRLYGDNFLAHYRLNVAIHALNTVLFFVLASLISSQICAGLFALLFAFHPVQGFYFGHASYLQYYVFVALLLMMILLLWSFMKSGSWCYLVSALVLYLLALGCRESAFAMPGAVLLFFGAFFNREQGFLKRLVPIFVSFAALDLYVLCWRLYLYRLVFNVSATHALPIHEAAIKYVKLLHALVYDVLGACDIAHTAHAFKYAYLVLVVLLVLYGWYCARTKMRIVGVALAACCLLVPSFAMAYHTRHLYDALPCVLFGFVLLADSVRLYAPIRIRRVLGSLFILLIASKSALCLMNVNRRADRSAFTQQKIQEIARTQALKNAPAICVLA